MTVLFTANYGKYDVLRPLPRMDVDCVAFTDDPSLEAPGWEVRVFPSSWNHPRMAAKWFKLHPSLALPGVKETVWMDASHGLINSSAIEGALAAVNDSGLAVHKHPGRDCIYDEAEASMGMVKYFDQPICDQVEHYRQEGHPEHWGLWACGTVATVRGLADDLLDAWWDENCRWSYQDQISLPVVCRRAGVVPGTFPYDQLRSPWFTPGGHTRED